MQYIKVKTIVSQAKNNDNWFGINYNMNIYQGCCHGCIYCDSRSNCYQIIDFDRVRAKENSTEIIKNELRSKRNKGVIGTGAMSDPYNPFERKLMLTRKALEEIDSNRFGVAIATKSDLVVRDIDILKRIQSHSPTLIKMTITTYDDNLCKKIEPSVCESSRRFEAIRKLSDNGIYVGVLLMPILPFINDSEENIKNIIKKAYESNAKFVFSYGLGVTLRQNQRQYYFDQLNKLFPGNNLPQRYINTYKESYINPASNNKKLWRVFKEECEKYNLLYKMEDIIKDYKTNYEKTQISWF
ncbi:SPL family radical SAM protein [Romboutsia lituseburensis]|uniref:DNA repair photolyase n=1 Tax=Romboutsia lituseburensis DSM 797 TaxID=1121325 RepID=A0A1G9J9Q7_9FIRM|nr:radical SAM protein [Romboutsia lituseburensis]SDL33943.1 DNA repair photolyase [Romboutsia lituseburensis DSM 797]